MKTKCPSLFIFVACLAAFRPATAQNSLLTYQGVVTDNGTNFNGTGQFAFALVTSTNTSSQATATAIMMGPVGAEYVSSIGLVSEGNGYTSVPTVSFSGGGGTGTVYTANLTSGKVTSFNEISVGSGYSSAPTVTISPPPADIVYVSYWSNDGSSSAGSQPLDAVDVGVTNGLFTIVLGQTNLANMTAIPASIFIQQNLQLRIWFSDGVNGFSALALQNLTPAPYANFATTASNLTGTISAATQLSGGPISSSLLPGFQSASNYNTVSGGSGNGILSSASDTTIGGGVGNTNSGSWGTIGGGSKNTNSAQYGSLGGGENNSLAGLGATIGGGVNNVVSSGALESTIGGGVDNIIMANVTYATIAGGQQNTNSGNNAAVTGGYLNLAGGNFSVVGGYENQALGVSAVIGGGGNNVAGASAENSDIGGGSDNNLTQQGANIGGGYNNTNTGQYAMIGGGQNNRSVQSYDAVSGGLNNTAGGGRSYVGGGTYNNAAYLFTTVAGGASNNASFYYDTVSGGVGNNTTNRQATVGGGIYNIAGGDSATVPGGSNNVASGMDSFADRQQAQATNLGAFVWADSQNAVFVSTNNDSFNVRAQGGARLVTSGAGMTVDGQYVLTGPNPLNAGNLTNLNAAQLTSGVVPNSVLSGFQGTTGQILSFTVLNGYDTIGGGNGNNTSEPAATIAGGYGNQATGYASFIGGGGTDSINFLGNTASGTTSVVAGGLGNTSSGEYSTIDGGYRNQATNTAATVAGGSNNIAGGQTSFAAGYNAQATNNGAFVWSDGSGASTVSTNANSVTMRASGGFRFMTSDSGTTTGEYLPAGGGGWVALSDRNSKENFQSVNASEVLAKVAALPMSTWNYKTEDASVRHIGPMAQDFKASFQVGETDTGICTVDEDGVALAAIQGLNQKLKEKDAEIAGLKEKADKVDDLEKQNNSLAARLNELEAAVKALSDKK